MASSPKESTYTWMREFHKASDSLNTARLGDFYSKNAVLRYASYEEIKGLDAVIGFFESANPLLESMKHEIVEIDTIENKIYLSCFITYVAKNDPESRQIRIPAFGKIFLVEEGEEKGKVERFEVYLDGSELQKRIGEVALSQKSRAEGS